MKSIIGGDLGIFKMPGHDACTKLAALVSADPPLALRQCGWPQSRQHSNQGSPDLQKRRVILKIYSSIALTTTDHRDTDLDSARRIDKISGFSDKKRA
jgi:hypothetical protein